ncbi:dehydrogenase with different specificitie [Aspergillus steynii IBT 23096]|uniref:Dehydrogenase with different specificitie n=1 Tax=Aspergillus steynii IBT 23096 TaxID=1392250 RepID=A0A2I2G3X3_9EURO|nr:dehydrogenase with different specificitie [Aspergillus steynii IBT 23096]PLB47580.1 dehydrogenase with different specificitie [Aspergillus steynii IBT 23096]
MESKYAKVHQSPKGPGDARPTALQIVKDAGREDNMTGKVILITGCSSGLGIETARALFQTGATLYLTARDLEKAKSALGDLVDSPRVHLLHLDLKSLESVRACAQEFLSRSKTLNILIANAGVMACPEGRTADGFETQFGTNHLAHFLLFYRLKSCLLSSSTPAFNSRVIIVASSAHRVSSVHLDNLSLQGEYEAWKSYGQSKTANIWTANEIERRYGAQGLHAFSLHPGAIATELLRHVSDEQKADWEKNDFLKNYWKSPEQGAATSVWAAVAKELEGTGGKYLDDCQIAPPADPSQRHGPGYAEWAYSPEMEARLWAKTLELLNEA